MHERITRSLCAAGVLIPVIERVAGLSVLLTVIGGLLFGWTWLRTHSIWLVSLEHALFGCFAFTVGLARYFHS